MTITSNPIIIKDELIETENVNCMFVNVLLSQYELIR